MALITRVDGAAAEAIRREIAKAGKAGAAKAPKAPPREKVLVSPFHSFDPGASCHTVQLPIFLAQPARRWKPPQVSNAQFAYLIRMDNEEYAAKRTHVGNELERYIKTWHHDAERRGQLRRIEYVRFSPLAGTRQEMDDDNLGTCFKAVRDAVCAYARWGAEWRLHIAAMGHADGWLKERGVKWVYTQAKARPNHRAHGIQIKLYV